MGILKDFETLILSSDRLNDEGVPSVSLALLEDAQGRISNHVITNGSENTDTLYQACSISKAVTALAIAKLVDQGLLRYDTKLIDHIPVEVLAPIVEFHTEHLLQYITVGLLVSHRSGISQHGFPGYPNTVPSYEEIISGKSPSNTPRLRLRSFPGAQFSYSGGGFVLLQMLLESITGMPFAHFMQDTVLKPLGMTRSLFGDLPPHEKNYARAYLTADTPGTSAPQGYHRFTELAAAGMWTTPTDLLKVIIALQYSLEHDDGFLTPRTARYMLTAVDFDPSSSLRSMAMGWGSDDTYFAHRGDNEPGYNCYFIGSHGGVVNNDTGRNVKTDLSRFGKNIGGLAIMTNSTLGGETLRKITAALFALKHATRRPFLPGNFGSMTDIVPYAMPHDLKLDSLFAEWVGKWSNGWELCLDEGYLEIALDGIEAPMRLRGGVCPLLYPDGGSSETHLTECVHWGVTFVVEGLDVGVRLLELDGEKIIELIQDGVQVLTRINAHV